MSELIIVTILFVVIMILLRERRKIINNPDPPQVQKTPSKKSVTNDELDRVLMLMQISGSITPQERNQIYVKTLPFTKQ